MPTRPGLIDLSDPSLDLQNLGLFPPDPWAALEFSKYQGDSATPAAAGASAFSSGADLGNDSFPRALPATAGVIAPAAALAQTAPTAQQLSNGQVVPSGSDAEVAFISGVTSSATVAATSFGAWDGNNPATYSPPYSYSTKWGSTTLSASGTPGGTVTYWFDTASNWTATEKNALASGLALWSAEANITFALAGSAASANFTFTRGSDGSAHQTLPNETPSIIGSGIEGSPGSGGFISIDTSVVGFGPLGASFSTDGGYPYHTLVHEEGHILGLGHGGPYNGDVTSSSQQFSAYDSRLWSLMSYIDPFDTSAKYYSSYPVTGTNWGISPDGYYYEPTTPMILDILAAQRLYGAATSGPLATGGQTFGFHSNISGLAGQYFDFTVNTHPVITIWDGGTNNTLDLSGFSANATISLVPGTFTSANGEVNNIGIAEGTTIDHVVAGGGSDSILGSSANDTIDPGGGNNTVDGGGGVNTLKYASHAGVQIINTLAGSAQNGLGGTDTFTHVQDFILGAANDTFNASGDGSNYTVDPGGGNNTINGGSGVLTLDYSSHAGTQVVDLFHGTAQNGSGGTDAFTNVTQVLMGISQDTVYGGPGNHLYMGGSANDNTISYVYATNPVTIDLATGTVQNAWGGVDHMGSFENFFGGQGDDTLLGGPGQVFLDGGGGWNIVDYSHDPSSATFDMLHGFYHNGYGGVDHLGNFEVFKGTPYDDLFVPPPGSIFMDGGAGTDTLDYSQQPGAIIADLSMGTVQNGFGGTDHISNFEIIIAGGQNDTLIGGPNASTLYGGGGNNTFVFKDGFGATTVADFTNSTGNVLDLSGVSAFHTFADIQSHMTQSGTDVVIADPAGGSVTIQNTTTAYLQAHQNEFIA